MRPKLTGLCLGLLAGLTLASAVSASDLQIWFPRPAPLTPAGWNEALPIGNGRLGAMIFGVPDKERLQLNDITVWAGGPAINPERAEAYQHLPEIRTALREGNYRASVSFWRWDELWAQQCECSPRAEALPHA